MSRKFPLSCCFTLHQPVTKHSVYAWRGETVEVQTFSLLIIFSYKYQLLWRNTAIMRLAPESKTAAQQHNCHYFFIPSQNVCFSINLQNSSWTQNKQFSFFELEDAECTRMVAFQLCLTRIQFVCKRHFVTIVPLPAVMAPMIAAAPPKFFKSIHIESQDMSAVDSWRGQTLLRQNALAQFDSLQGVLALMCWEVKE